MRSRSVMKKLGMSYDPAEDTSIIRAFRPVIRSDDMCFIAYSFKVGTHRAAHNPSGPTEQFELSGERSTLREHIQQACSLLCCAAQFGQQGVESVAPVLVQ